MPQSGCPWLGSREQPSSHATLQYNLMFYLVPGLSDDKIKLHAFGYQNIAYYFRMIGAI